MILKKLFRNIIKSRKPKNECLLIRHITYYHTAHLVSDLIYLINNKSA